MEIKTIATIILLYFSSIAIRLGIRNHMDQIKNQIKKLKKIKEKIKEKTPNSAEMMLKIVKIVKDDLLISLFLFFQIGKLITWSVRFSLSIIKNAVNIFIFGVIFIIGYTLYKVKTTQFDECLHINFPFSENIDICLSSIILWIEALIHSLF